MKKKVLFLITKSNWGGAQRYVYDLATTLDRNEYEPIVALGGDGELIEKLQAANIKTIQLTSLTRDVSVLRELTFARELFNLIKTEQPEVLHVNSSKAGGVGCLVGRVAQVPRILFTAHGWAFNEDRPFWQRLIIKKLHWLTVLFSHHTIAVSKAIVTQMNWPFAQQKMSVINPGRTIPTFEKKLAARQIITDRTPALTPYITDTWLLIIAELHPIKQHKLLFQAIKNVISTNPRTRLICIGDGELRESLNDYIHSQSLQEHIFLTGPIHEAAHLLKAADLFVLPSKSESYGYVLHEAGLAGIPIIASNVGGIRDIVTHPINGTLVHTPLNKTLTVAIKDCLNQPHIYHDKANKLTEKLQARTVKAMAEETTKLY